MCASLLFTLVSLPRLDFKKILSWCRTPMLPPLVLGAGSSLWWSGVGCETTVITRACEWSGTRPVGSVFGRQTFCEVHLLPTANEPQTQLTRLCLLSSPGGISFPTYLKKLTFLGKAGKWEASHSCIFFLKNGRKKQSMWQEMDKKRKLGQEEESTHLNRVDTFIFGHDWLDILTITRMFIFRRLIIWMEELNKHLRTCRHKQPWTQIYLITL